MATYSPELASITLVFVSEEGEYYTEPLTDLTDCGTLIDPETGEDMEFFGYKIDGGRVSINADLVLMYRSEAGDEYEQNVDTIIECGTLIDPDTGDDMELVGWYVS